MSLSHLDEKVGSSKVTLLTKLRIRPFSVGFVVPFVYDSDSVFNSEVFDLV